MDEREAAARALAALADAADAGQPLPEMPDAQAADDFLAVRAVLRGYADVPRDLHLPDALRREQ